MTIAQMNSMQNNIGSLIVRRVGRQRTGNVIALCIITFWVISMLLAFCCAVGALVFVHNAVQRALDDAALSSACQLNLNDRIGQMNNMTVRSRQLVFADRQTDNELLQTGSAYEKLSAQLLAQSRDSAQILDAARAKLITISKQDVNAAANAAFNTSSTQQSLTLPWLRISRPVLLRTTLGTVSGVDDNAASLPELADLLTYDQSHSFIDTHSNLYNEQINAKLPTPDNDLNFNLSSLPPYLNSTVPSRLMLGQSFVQQDDQQLHSSVQLESQLTVSLLCIPHCSTTLHLTSTATTNGAGQFP